MKILATVHAFYPAFWPELVAGLRRVDAPCDIVVTVPEATPFVSTIKNDFPSAHILFCENRGFDIWPFFKVLDTMGLSSYTHVLKLHTKRDVHRDPPMVFNAFNYEGPRWRNALLDIISSEDTVAKCRSLFARDPTVTMIAGRDVILRRRDVDSPAVRKTFDDALRYAATEFNIRPHKPEFVAGTMFFAKAEIFRPFLGRFSADDFAVSAKDDTIVTRAHLLERVIGFAACAAGRIADPEDSMRWRHLKSDLHAFAAPIQKFLYQSKTTRNGAKIVKVCRIPVWHANGAGR